jgi:signal recognition particle GTPase
VGKKSKKSPLLPLQRMSKPVLLIIAGCNGSGKSTFPKPLAPDNFSF